MAEQYFEDSGEVWYTQYFCVDIDVTIILLVVKIEQMYLTSKPFF